jgi:hypothetical protein
MPLSAPAAALAALIGLAPGLVFAQGHAATPHTAASQAAGAVPGFETLADGTSRLFVELTKPVAYETKTAKGTVTYVLKGARVSRRNNTNALVTVHFNTPVTSARLVPHGHDLWFVVELRAPVQPSVSMDAGKDGGAVMHIELPKGQYLPAEASVPPASGSAPPVDAPASRSVDAPASRSTDPSKAATPEPPSPSP